MNDKTDVAVQGGPEPADPPALITGRRLLRWTAVVGIGILAVLACWQDPSYARGTAGRGHHPTCFSVAR